MVITESFKIHTEGNTDIIDITDKVVEKVKNSKVSSGIVTVFIAGSTASITTIEYERNLLKDIKEIIEKLIPQDFSYRHPFNAFSHIRSSIFGTSLTIPFKDKRLILGTWQQIVLIDFDNRPRVREVILQIIGE